MNASSRELAARAVMAVLDGRSLDDALEPARRTLPDARDAALVQALAYGVLRDWRLLDALTRSMMREHTPLPALRALLAVGLYQLRSMRIPEHAAVAATVDATAALGLSKLRGLVNALLRRYLRERDALEAAVPSALAVRLSHPEWLVAALREDWGADAFAVMAANNQQAPLVLRVNRRGGSREAWLARARTWGVDAEPVAGSLDAVVLEQALPVERIPGFAEGQVSVQDASAQLAAPLLDLSDGQRVLDACAAPGGKSAHILECADVQLTALDCDAERLQRVTDTLLRTGLAADCRVADASRPADWWDGTPYDRILLDAPCSGTGVIRRHPDIKWLRRAEDITRMAREQRHLLDTLFPLLAPGGVLVYATCSLLAAEGETLVRGFLGWNPEARRLPVPTEVGVAQKVGLRIAPGGAWDGFYYARLQRGKAP